MEKHNEAFEKSEAGKAIRCLYLELPSEIVDDVKRKVIESIDSSFRAGEEKGIEIAHSTEHLGMLYDGAFKDGQEEMKKKVLKAKEQVEKKCIKEDEIHVDYYIWGMERLIKQFLKLQ